MIQSTYFVLLLSVGLSSGCFLNSCPYRRYGRNLQCGFCGPEASGLCVAENKCCMQAICFQTEECSVDKVCPSKKCTISKGFGRCLVPKLCCNNSICQMNAQCD